MKIAGRAGHNVLSPGTSALVDEVKENRPIFYASKKYLEKFHTFIDCTPEPVANQSIDIYYGINKANNVMADLFYSVHLNNTYNRYEEAIGAEIWLYPNAKQATIAKANRILTNFATLGFKNRGIKWGDNVWHNYAEIFESNCEAMIIECFFLDAMKDTKLYEIVGADALGYAIANGIDPSITKDIAAEKIEKTIDYEKELCRIIVNGNNVIALTGKTKCINYAKANYEGTIRIQCIKDNAILVDENKLLNTQTIVPTNPIGEDKERVQIVSKPAIAKEQILANDNNKNEEVKEAKYNFWQIIMKFFIDIINRLFEK